MTTTEQPGNVWLPSGLPAGFYVARYGDHGWYVAFAWADGTEDPPRSRGIWYSRASALARAAELNGGYSR